MQAKEGSDELGVSVASHRDTRSFMIFTCPQVLHYDNGAPMTSYTVKARLAELGVLALHSRPRVSNDNPYSESLFKTVKYCPEWPSEGFLSIEASRDWMLAFEHAYNDCHLHSGLNRLY